MNELIQTSDNLPAQMAGAKNLTLDEIDARNVLVEIKTKKSYSPPRVKITNSKLVLMTSPTIGIPVALQVLQLAREARRRLRHPNNQSFATPFQGAAWGKVEFIEKPGYVQLVATIGGQHAVTVTSQEIEAAAAEKKQKKEEPLIVMP